MRMNLKSIASAVTPVSWTYKVGAQTCTYLLLERCCHSIEFFYNGNLYAVVVARQSNFIYKFRAGASGKGNGKKNVHK